MPWTGHNRLVCKVCNTMREPGERLSARGKCRRCAKAAQLEQVEQLQAHAGPRFQHWRRRTAAAVGAVLLDDLRDES